MGEGVQRWVRGCRDGWGGAETGEETQGWVRGHVYILSLQKYIFYCKQFILKLKLNHSVSGLAKSGSTNQLNSPNTSVDIYIYCMTALSACPPSCKAVCDVGISCTNRSGCRIKMPLSPLEIQICDDPPWKILE